MVFKVIYLFVVFKFGYIFCFNNLLKKKKEKKEILKINIKVGNGKVDG